MRGIFCRAWQAYHDRTKDAVERWKEVSDYISVESMLEGFPLIYIAMIYVFHAANPCVIATCDPVTIAQAFPSSVLTLPPNPSLSPNDVIAIHHDNSQCSQQPLTSDGWFTMGMDRLNASFVDRPAGILERIIEFEIPGVFPPSKTCQITRGNSTHS